MKEKFQLHQSPEGVYTIRSIEADECFTYFQYKTEYNTLASAKSAYSWLEQYYKDNTSYKHSHHWVLKTREFPLLINSDECKSKSLSVADVETTMNSTQEP